MTFNTEELQLILSVCKNTLDEITEQADPYDQADMDTLLNVISKLEES